MLKKLKILKNPRIIYKKNLKILKIKELEVLIRMINTIQKKKTRPKWEINLLR